MKFHEDRCKGEAFMRLKPFYLTARLQTDGRTDRQTDRQTDRRTDRVIPVYPPPPNFVAGGITTFSPDQESLHEVFLSTIKIQRNKNKQILFLQFSKKKVGFHCLTTSPWRTQANPFNKIHLHIIIII